MRVSCGTTLVLAAVGFLAGFVDGAQPDTSRLQTAVVATSSEIMFGTYSDDPLSSASWGGDLPGSDAPLQATLVNLHGQSAEIGQGCRLDTLANNSAIQQNSIKASKFILLVDRGNCTFTQKALIAQQLGAVGLIITDTVEAIYNASVRVNGSKYDKKGAFDCDQGQATLSSLASPPWSDLNDAAACSSASTCTSGRCIPTGSGNQVCCMWDVADYMGYGEDADKVTIPVVRIRAVDASKLQVSSVSLYKRFVPKVDAAQVLIWLIAIATITACGYFGSALERKKATVKRVHSNPSGQVPATVHAQLQQEMVEEPALDINWKHAVGFLVFGSAFLLLLFYVNVVMIVIVMFCFGASSAVGTILISPLLHSFQPLKKQLFDWSNNYLGAVYVSIADILSFAISAGLVLFWVFTRHEDYSWILQDVFGVCVCILFLQTIRLPNIKVATILLILVFLYDIFFVFLSPYVFGRSVMIVAAQGGKQDDSTAPSSYCLRYPQDTAAKCIKEAIPILIRLPKITNWLGGEAMLGLGDIVLPGLLLVFCARYDYATRGNVLGAPIRATAAAYPGKLGLFVYMCIGYAVGLFLANLGVILMQSGQPALLYLVPCTLGVLSIMTWRAGLIKKLWDGPKEFYQLPEVEEVAAPATATHYVKSENGTPVMSAV
ncbi:Signal peptide peptidase-like 2A [Aphanomyces cochlioides]|nr:Signal peptide peptidase-like 2A [Aphanomyces cochlioides]